MAFAFISKTIFDKLQSGKSIVLCEGGEHNGVPLFEKINDAIDSISNIEDLVLIEISVPYTKYLTDDLELTTNNIKVMANHEAILRTILSDLHAQAKKAYAAKNQNDAYVIQTSWELIAEKFNAPTCVFHFTYAKKGFKAFDYKTAKQVHFIEYGEEFDSSDLRYMRSYQVFGEKEDFLVFDYELDYDTKTGFYAQFKINAVVFTVYLSDSGDIMDFGEFGDYHEGTLQLHGIAEKIQAWHDVLNAEKASELIHYKEVSSSQWA